MAGDTFAGPKTALKHRRSITGWRQPSLQPWSSSARPLA